MDKNSPLISKLKPFLMYL